MRFGGIYILISRLTSRGAVDDHTQSKTAPSLLFKNLTLLGTKKQEAELMRKKRYIGALGTVNSPEIGALDTQYLSIKTVCHCVCKTEYRALKNRNPA